MSQEQTTKPDHNNALPPEDRQLQELFAELPNEKGNQYLSAVILQKLKNPPKKDNRKAEQIYLGLLIILLSTVLFFFIYDDPADLSIGEASRGMSGKDKLIAGLFVITAIITGIIFLRRYRRHKEYMDQFRRNH